ncbi:alpha/beta hydrolase [Marivita sp. S0852]|uniref:alpha/beta hydrolase n=1 Tax=Marivita sp. S0852 TaxID=3373893 RepID=UPI003982B855
MQYLNSHPWKTYRNILQEEFNLKLHTEPMESRRIVNGHDIHIDEWAARDPDGTVRNAPHGTVVLVHGGGGNGRVLAPFADAITQLSWRVVAPDLPGFGLTKPRADWRGNYAEWPKLVAEIADGEAGRVILMGLSMGGLTAVYAATLMSRPAGIIVTTLLDLAEPWTFVGTARNRFLGLASLVSARITPFVMDRLSLPLALAAPLDAMSANARMTHYFQNDRLLGRRWVPLRFWRTAHRFGPPPTALPCDLLLVHPGADAWTPPAKSIPVFERITTPKHYVLLDGGSHLPIEPAAFAQLSAEVATFLAERS